MTIRPMHIGQAIEYFRRLAGITQSELAARVEISQGNLSRVINGKQDVPFSLLSSICKSLGVKVSDVVAFAENGDSESARWRNLYPLLSPEDREAAFRLLEPRSTYQTKS